MTAEDRAGWRQVVCGMCFTGSDQTQVKSDIWENSYTAILRGCRTWSIKQCHKQWPWV